MKGRIYLEDGPRVFDEGVSKPTLKIMSEIQGKSKADVEGVLIFLKHTFTIVEWIDIAEDEIVKLGRHVGEGPSLPPSLICGILDMCAYSQAANIVLGNISLAILDFARNRPLSSPMLDIDPGMFYYVTDIKERDTPNVRCRHSSTYKDIAIISNYIDDIINTLRRQQRKLMNANP